MNTLYYGDNLEILRTHIPDESVDLVYLDPPFNSSRTYNLLFKQHKGDSSPAQIMAFEDTWTWSPLLYAEFQQDPRISTRLLKLVTGLHDILGDSEMMAYVLMMAPRLQELHRVLKPTGSLYLHCDPVASHYLKIMLDATFGPTGFGNEIIWQRINAKGLAFTRFARNHDLILRYTKSDQWVWNPVYAPHDPAYVEQFYKYVDPDTGRRYRLADLSNPNKNRPNLNYEFLGVTRVWRWTKERMQDAFDKGLIVQAKPGAVPALKRYLDEQEGTPIGDVWTDIPPVQFSSKERRGYPTQKPLKLLERIVQASSKEGDVVLDPFCGCGTAVVAASRLGRRWIGIDITYLAIAEITHRLKTETDEERDKTYQLVGSPKDEYSARKFFEETAPENHKPFEMWAVSLLEAEPQEKKGSDKGIDGRLPVYFDQKGTLGWVLVQVKGGSTGPKDVRDFGHVIETNKALMGVFVCFHRTRDMQVEAEKLGFASAPSGRKVPRMQIVTIKELLEEKKRPDIPEGWTPRRSTGVGKPTGGQLTLEEGES